MAPRSRRPRSRPGAARTEPSRPPKKKARARPGSRGRGRPPWLLVPALAILTLAAIAVDLRNGGALRSFLRASLSEEREEELSAEVARVLEDAVAGDASALKRRELGGPVAWQVTLGGGERDAGARVDEGLRELALRAAASLWVEPLDGGSRRYELDRDGERAVVLLEHVRQSRSAGAHRPTPARRATEFEERSAAARRAGPRASTQVAALAAPAKPTIAAPAPPAREEAAPAEAPPEAAVQEAAPPRTVLPSDPDAVAPTAAPRSTLEPEASAAPSTSVPSLAAPEAILAAVVPTRPPAPDPSPPPPDPEPAAASATASGEADASRAPRAPATPPIPPSRTAPACAIIIDDLGEHPELLTQALAIDMPLTFAVIPFLSGTRTCARALASQGREVILHLPMEPLSYPRHDPGPRALFRGQSAAESRRRTLEALAEVPEARGVNNHMGSSATRDRRLMRDVLSVIQERHLFFIDSRTAQDSIAHRVAMELGIPSAERQVFLDRDDFDEEFTRQQLRLLFATARRDGRAIGIGHWHEMTLRVVREEARELAGDDVRILPASAFVEPR